MANIRTQLIRPKAIAAISMAIRSIMLKGTIIYGVMAPGFGEVINIQVVRLMPMVATIPKTPFSVPIRISPSWKLVKPAASWGMMHATIIPTGKGSVVGGCCCSVLLCPPFWFVKPLSNDLSCQRITECRKYLQRTPTLILSFITPYLPP